MDFILFVFVSNSLVRNLTSRNATVPDADGATHTPSHTHAHSPTPHPPTLHPAGLEYASADWCIAQVAATLGPSYAEVSAHQNRQAINTHVEDERISPE